MEHLDRYSSERLAFRTRVGRPLVARRVRPGDAVLLADLLAHLSDRARWLRYMSPRPLNGAAALAEAARMACGLTRDHVTLVVTGDHCGAEEIVAVAELARDPAAPAAAEIAIVVRDDEQRVGIGGVLLARLIQFAQAAGITSLRGDMLAENRPVLRLIDRLGVSYTRTFHSGTAQVVLALPAEAVVELPAARERVTVPV